MVQKLLIFVEGGAGRGGGVEIIRYAYRFHSLHPEHSLSAEVCVTESRTLQMDAQHNFLRLFCNLASPSEKRHRE